MKWNRETQAVQADKYDRQDWEDVLFDMDQVQRNRDEIWEKHNYVGEAFQDFFMQLFVGDPMMNDKSDMQEDHIFNHHIVDQFKDWQEVAELRVSTKYDPYSAAFAMITLQPEIKRLYEENKALMDLMDKIKELLEQLAQTGDLGEAGELEGQIQALVGEANEAMGSIVVDFKGKVKQASQELENEDALMRTFGLEQGQLQRMNFKERRALAEKLKTGKFAQFSNLIGQFKLVAKGARRSKVSTVPDEIAGLELGRDLGNMSIESLIALSVPEMELKFWSDFMNYELVQKKVVGPHSLGKGPIIVVCDESGSMGAGCYGGTREMWSKALCLALIDQARRNKRDFIYIGFSGGTTTYHAKFPKGRVDHKLLVEFIEHFYGGGTYPFTALMEAAKIVDSYPANNRPDIVFITDGEFGTPGGYGGNYSDQGWYDEWERIGKKTDMQSFGVAFDGEPREMKKIVDTVINLESLTADPKKMGEMFSKIMQDR